MIATITFVPGFTWAYKLKLTTCGINDYRNINELICHSLIELPCTNFDHEQDLILTNKRIHNFKMVRAENEYFLRNCMH